MRCYIANKQHILYNPACIVENWNGEWRMAPLEASVERFVAPMGGTCGSLEASMWVCKQNEIYYILLMNGGGVVFVFESSRQKDLKKKKIKELPYNYKKSLFISGQREQVHSHIST